MPTPKEGYHLKDGTKVPSTTTITGRYKDSGGLMDWVWEQGIAGIPWRETRDKAGEKGTKIHGLLHLRLMENPVLSWPGLTHIKVLWQETSLVSEVYKFGGTPDAIGIDTKGRYVLLDWKTSKGFYGDHLLQLAAYNTLWNENYPECKIGGGSYVVRFTKGGDFIKFLAFDAPDIPNCPSLGLAWEQFRDLVPIYKREKPLKGLLDEAITNAESGANNVHTDSA